MPENVEQTTQVTGQAGQKTGEQTTNTQAPGEESQTKLLTQEEVDRIVQSRLKRAEMKWEADYSARLEEEKKRGQMEESERLKLEKAEAERRAADADARVLRAERKAELTGKVTNPDRVLLLMGEKAADYFGEDGTVDSEAVLKDFPEYAPAAEPTPKPSPTALPGVRPPAGKAPSLETQQAEAAKRGNVREFIRLSFKKE